jgi:hypothetical protein
MLLASNAARACETRYTARMAIPPTPIAAAAPPIDPTALDSLSGAVGVPSPFALIAQTLGLGSAYQRHVVAHLKSSSLPAQAIALLAVQLTDHKGNSISVPRQILLRWSDVQYDPEGAAAGILLLASALIGVRIASGTTWGLFETDARGRLEIALNETPPRTIYAHAETPPSGLADSEKSAIVIASNSVPIVWSS